MMQQKIVVAGAIVLAVALALPAAAVIFTSGGGGGSDCERAEAAFADLSGQARAARAETDRQSDATAQQQAEVLELQIVDAQAYLLVNRPDCFAPADVAAAQQHLDMARAR